MHLFPISILQKNRNFITFNFRASVIKIMDVSMEDDCSIEIVIPVKKKKLIQGISIIMSFFVMIVFFYNIEV